VGWTLLIIYAAVALVSAVTVYILSRRLGDELRPSTHRVILSLLAGVAWPLLLFGLVEFGVFAAYTKRRTRATTRRPASER
jgi:hypothetical protein